MARVRRLPMGRIRSKNTKPETQVQSALPAADLSFEVHVKNLLSTPDIIFREARIALFAHGIADKTSRRKESRD